MKYDLTEKEKEWLLIQHKARYNVVDSCIFETSPQGYFYPKITHQTKRCWCKLNRGKVVDNLYCPECGGSFDYSATTVSTKELATKLKELQKSTMMYYGISNYIHDTITLGSFFYVKRHPEVIDGALVYKLTVSVKGGATASDPEKLLWKIDGIVEIKPNDSCRAFKISRGKEVEIDALDTLGISSQIKYGKDIYFEDSTGMIDFMLKNKSFSKHIGFMECFNLVDVQIPRSAFFLLYIYLYVKYPVVELVVKMGYINLITQIMKNLANGYNKENIRNMAEELNRIMQKDVTRGSLALTVPKYLADNLNYREASIREYEFWGDMCQLSENWTLSKECYDAVSRNECFLAIKNDNKFDYIPNIMKFGFLLPEVMSYANKQMKRSRDAKLDLSYHGILNTWHDYLNMCDLMNVAPDKFPKDIGEVHDKLAKAFSVRLNEYNDKAINQFAKEAEKHIPETKEYTNSDYVIVLPHSMRDVVREGQAMHNCVGSYIDRIVKRESLVFFIRKKEDPTASYVTAEYRRGGLRQCYYKNNYTVRDKEILDIANDYCRKLNNAVEFKSI